MYSKERQRYREERNIYRAKYEKLQELTGGKGFNEVYKENIGKQRELIMWPY